MSRWSREIKIVLLLLALVVGLSLFIGHLTLLLLLLCLGLLITQTMLINKLERNLSRRVLKDNKDAKGIWADIYYHLYRIKKKERQRKKKLGKMVDRFRKSTDALPDAAVVLGKDDYIEWINKSAMQVLGLKKSDRGQRIVNLVRSPVFIRYLRSNDYRHDITIPSPVNEEILLQINIVPYGAGLRLLLAQDITHLRKLESMRRDFAANISHELRTPLTVLKGYLETLREQDADNPFYLRTFEKMSQQTDRIQHLVDDLLLLTRLETKEKHSECVNIGELLENICHEGNVISSSSDRVRLKIECQDNLQGDPQELRSAFSNLIVNALKYSQEDSPVFVRWKKAGKGACLEIEDKGEGIASHEIPRITERFYRVDIKRPHKINGTGLGLSIVKHVLLRHDAKLEIHSQLGKGSRFCCVFPEHRLC